MKCVNWLTKDVDQLCDLMVKPPNKIIDLPMSRAHEQRTDAHGCTSTPRSLDE